MAKKLLCLVFTLILVLSFVPFAASAASNTFGTELVLETEGEIKSGDSFKVTVYVNDIDVADGLLSADLPLKYDADKLEYVSKTEIYPEIWNGKGDNFCADEPDSAGVYWQRLIYDGFDDGYVDKGIKDDRLLGVTITFRAVGGAQGEAVVAIKSDADEQISGAGLDASEIVSLDGAGSELKVNITYDPSVPVESGDTSVPEGSEGEVVGDVSEEQEISDADASQPQSDESATPVESLPEVSSKPAADATSGFSLPQILIIIAVVGVVVAVIVFAWAKLSAAKAAKKAEFIKDDDDEISDDVDLK